VTAVLPSGFDADAFLAEVDALREKLDAGVDAGDARHLRAVEAVAVVASVTGWTAAFAGHWAVGAVGIALGRFVRWTCVAHHVLHRGYDAVPGLPEHRRSKGFARGWRRMLDWPDWMFPAAWIREHNQLHHYRLGELDDPDLVEENARVLQPSWAPLPLRALFVFGVASSWRWLYFAPAAIREWQDHRAGHHDPPDRAVRMDSRMLLPVGPGANVWRLCYLPFAGVAFGALPALGLVLGPEAAASALGASLLAEWIVNLHSYAVIVPNHAGDDLWRFDTRVRGRAELVLRQIVGSVDFRTGGFLNDLLHGWLNYQIEHHVWPDLSMRQLVRAQPALRELCERHGVPYAQEGVLARNRRLFWLMVGRDEMRRADHALADVSSAGPGRSARGSRAAPDPRAAGAG
jgi:fatty acid desaturase